MVLFATGLKPSTAAFFFYILTIFNTSLAGTSVALLLSSTVNNHAVGTILTSLVWVIMMVFGGLLVNLASLPPWLQWVRFTSIFSYSMNVSGVYYSIRGWLQLFSYLPCGQVIFAGVGRSLDTVSLASARGIIIQLYYFSCHVLIIGRVEN